MNHALKQIQYGFAAIYETLSMYINIDPFDPFSIVFLFSLACVVLQETGLRQNLYFLSGTHSSLKVHEYKNFFCTYDNQFETESVLPQWYKLLPKII